MISVDEDALVCDLAETYQIYDYKQLPASMVAVFSCGLRETSRIKMKLSGQKIPLDTILLAGISDNLRLLLWTKTKDGQKNVNRPESILHKLSENNPREKEEIIFDSGEDFEKMRQQLLGNTIHGGE
ncbi:MULTISPECIES: DUF5361 domain-containing protein [Enterococcus]|jgi:hypothetical protein|uniref:DUF5361 domain-containing protein n=1 Tax=Enterococcus TaxID=1350 RepID=UPI0012E2FDE4|nr:MULTISPECIES: DUF5361 domain-containing protein [Enterococcus]MDT2698350.1 DUF5361 domain-containing protein [Enterococcus gallinarum]MEB8399696.1 DUF5361 domain-containing protein [Enterococcus casseliflavus]MUN75245.1 hypothetical protein [Enterococcus casseliflavus]MUN96117.1 hypothetical protein [Enterococcus casseliflavus]